MSESNGPTPIGTGSNVLADLGTRTKLAAGFGVVLALLCAVGYLGLARLSAAQERMDQMGAKTLPALASIATVQERLTFSRFLITNVAQVPDQAVKAEQVALIKSVDGDLDAAFDKYVASSMTQHPEEVAAFKTELAGWRSGRDGAAMKYALANNNKAFSSFRSKNMAPHYDAATEKLTGLAAMETKDSEKSIVESRSAYTSARNFMLALIAVAIGVGIGLTMLLTRLIAGPLREAVDVLQEVAKGRLDVRLNRHSRDEVGKMSTALDTALDSMQGAMKELGGNAQSLAAASEELSATAVQISSSTSSAATQLNQLAESATEVSTSVQTVASGTEEMSASIREISGSATGATQIASEAVSVADATMHTVTKLGESSTEVGNVVKLITSIAEQTNLLALNATIEAARAGEAGKGFAVVAAEVKELAQETAKATEDIYSRVEAIQADTAEAVSAIERITHIITTINDSQQSIASAVEEQTATTSEMGRSVSLAADSTEAIARNVASTSVVADEANRGAANTADAAVELSRMASSIQSLIGRFSY